MDCFKTLRWPLVAMLNAVTLMLPAAAASARPGAMLEFEQRTGARSERVRFAVSPSHVAVLNEGGQATLVYDRTRRLLTLLDHGARVFRQLDRPHLERLAAEVDAAMRQTRARIDALPPAERARAERALADMMGSRGPAGAAALSIGAAGQGARAAGVACRWHEMRTGDAVIGRVCTAEPQRVPGGDGVLELLAAMSEAYAHLSRLTATQLPAALRGNPLMPVVVTGRLPVLMHAQRDGGEDSESRLLSARAAPVADALFAIPAGFRDAFGGS